jgi:hypothetical protein
MGREREGGKGKTLENAWEKRKHTHKRESFLKMEADGNLPLRVSIEVNQICTNCFLFLGIMHSQFKQAEKPNEKKIRMQ